MKGQIDIRRQLRTYKVLPGFLIGDDSPVRVARAAFVEDQVQRNYSLQLKLELCNQYRNSGLAQLEINGVLLNAAYSVLGDFQMVYKDIPSHNVSQYFGTKNILNVQRTVADYISIRSIKFVDYETRSVHELTFDNSNGCSYIEVSGIRTTGQFANNALFKPTWIDNQKYWMCSCGTLNDSNFMCGTCGNTFESAQDTVNPVKIKELERIEANRKIAESKGKSVKILGLQMRILLGIMLAVNILFICFDRVPVFLKTLDTDIFLTGQMLLIAFILNIVLSVRNPGMRQTKTLSLEPYGRALQVLFIVLSSIQFSMIVILTRHIVYIQIVGGIHLFIISNFVLVYKQQTKYIKGIEFKMLICTILQILLQIAYCIFISDQIHGDTMIKAEYMAAYGQVFMCQVYPWVIYIIQLGNRYIHDPTMRFDGIFNRHK